MNLLVGKNGGNNLKRSLISIISVFIIVAVMSCMSDVTTYARQSETSNTDSGVVIPTISGRAHIQNRGWISIKNGMLGTVGQGLRLEALQLSVSGVSGLGIRYRAHVQNIGWQTYASDGGIAGTSGRALRVEAVQIEFTGIKASDYDIYYRAHVQDIGWMGWVKNGAKAGTEGKGKRLEAIEYKIVAKSGGSANSSSGKMSNTISMQAYVQDYGWTATVNPGTILGVTGQGKRLESIKFTPVGYDMNIEYRVHVQNTGWTSYVKNGEVVGTTGSGLRLEAVQIRLTGNDAENYDIYYRAHVQNIGWLDWAKNDEMAGTSGSSLRLEALDVRIVPKGQGAPGSTDEPYRENVVKLTQAQIYARAKLDQVGWDLKNAFNYAASFTYYRAVSVPASGQHLEEYAKYGFVNGRGNCYVMASVFCQMARELGYECYLVEGYVPKRGGGTTVHGWTEIVVNGKTYVCDPDFTNETGRNGYMITYGTSGTWVYQEYSRVN